MMCKDECDAATNDYTATHKIGEEEEGEEKNRIKSLGKGSVADANRKSASNMQMICIHTV